MRDGLRSVSYTHLTADVAAAHAEVVALVMAGGIEPGILRQLKRWTIEPSEEQFGYVLFLPGNRFQEPCCNRPPPISTG